MDGTIEPVSIVIMYQRDRVFRDPVHGLIQIRERDSFLTELINTEEFQRLHRVRQLGVGSLTFPGADHSRFSHSLGVLHVAMQILEILAGRYKDDRVVELVSKHRQTIMAAALLHDLGHGPFSHLMERAFESQKDHEQRTKDIIVSPQGQVRSALEKGGLDPDEVKEVIDHKFPFVFLQDIVSSQLDADRMDYLMRDSHFAGVEYGAFDLPWILNCLCVGSFGDDPDNPKRWRLCLDNRRGLQAAEQLILGRQHMSLQVYFHKSTRRWEAIFLCLIREAARLAAMEELPQGTSVLVQEFLKLRGKVEHQQFLRLDEAQMLAAFSLWKDASQNKYRWLATLSKGFLDRKKVMERIDLPEDLPSDAETLLRERIRHEFASEGDSKWELDPGEFSPYKGLDPSIRKIDPEGYEESVATSAILLADGNIANGSATPVSEVSSIFRLLSKERFRLRRLYCAPELKNRMDKLAKETLESLQLNSQP